MDRPFRSARRLRWSTAKYYSTTSAPSREIGANKPEADKTGARIANSKRLPPITSPNSPKIKNPTRRIVGGKAVQPELRDARSHQKRAGKGEVENDAADRQQHRIQVFSASRFSTTIAEVQ